MRSTALIIIIMITIIIKKREREVGKVPMQCPIILLLKRWAGGMIKPWQVENVRRREVDCRE
jgi:hypothetical protein